MFENILGQPASDQLKLDIANNSLAPSLLFYGPKSSGKGSAALELARVISCESKASWNCACTSCARHRLLLHPDLMCLGSRSFSAEIAAAGNAFLREIDSVPAKLLFIRAVRKLLARFNQALEEESKLSKLAHLVLSLEEELDELETADSAEEKHVNAVIKNAYKLESDGIGSTIPIEHIRRAAYWSHLAPSGKRKLLLIENAGSMKDSAKNSLLKLLEEPPPSVTIALTAVRPNALLPTILSRLRPYRFTARSEETEKEVIRRVFRSDVSFENNSQGRHSLINSYLDSFLPVQGETLKSLAAFFTASAAFNAAFLLKKQGIQNLPAELVLLGKFSTTIAEAAGLEKTRDSREIIAKVLDETSNFEVRSMFTRFISLLMAVVLDSLKTSSSHSTCVITFLDLWKKYTGETETAAMIYNQNPGLALERLFVCVSRGMAGL